MNLQIQRFPRTSDKLFLYVALFRAKYKPPPYNFRTDGSWNPADGVLNSLLKCDKKQLRRLCKKHALDYKGWIGKLIRRLYLHWRAAKFEHQGVKVGSGEFIGYGKGYENTRIPNCPCGSRSRIEVREFEKKKEDFKEQRSRMKKEIMKPSAKRFPRYKKGRIHFPRL